ncbi:hypothetical protein INS49_012297 [Diaporthe citri]|uniref:uncharacterized protein n=1 Tax=Diaporthe citri TaxID=83186 RepID=UPI001C7E67CA|nr:uncharacterized protein INS49_012297 [Diaporthe citri]KAG6358778.1 hypothetical protein INS49_012297 [Diaporthe citri]
MLATFIGFYENSPEDEFDFQNADSSITGLGLGLFSAAAVSMAPTLADLPIAGAEAVRVAFRLGVMVDEVSRNLQHRSEGNTRGDSWAYVVLDTVVEEVQRELDAVHAADNTPESNKIFVSALIQTSVTVSGPPGRLKHLFNESEFFRDSKSIALPVYGGLCHAKHIYTKKHVDEIAKISSLDDLDTTGKFIPRVPILSTNNGKPFPAKTAGGLLHNIVEEILTQVIRWDNTIKGVAQHAKRVAAPEHIVLMFGTSPPCRDIVEALSLESQQLNVTTKDLTTWITEPNKLRQGPREYQHAKIAIVGMSCRMPGADDTEAFWEVLNQGLDMHRKVPADRFDVESHCDPSGKRVNTSITPYGCFIDNPGLFDAPFFNMSPREALQTDPMQRLALVTAYEALERSGYVANRTASTDLHRVGTFYGQASDDYREVNTAQEIGTYFITGGCRAFGPGRINYFFKFSGPSYSIDTACSSGLATIHIACNSLWNGDTDMAVAGGMNVLTNSDAFAGLSNGHFLSKTPNACKTWDCEADGYCRADGVASVVLKRLEDAEADNDNILGVILAAGTNHSAEAVSITHPHAGHQAYLTRQILSQAAVDPLDVSYVEMHGTGTQAGDAQEIQSVTDVFAPLGRTKRRSSNQPLHIGAVKANVGHGEAVAGTTALLKVLLMFDKEVIPPHVGIKNSINPGFPKDLEQRHLHIPYEKTPWPRQDRRKRIAVVNNFSAAGGNTSIVIEEGPSRTGRTGGDENVVKDPRATHVVAVSAKSKTSLKGNLQRLIAYLDTNPDVSLPDLAYTTTARRYHHNHRVAVATPDVAHLKRQLASYLESADTHKPVPSTGSPPVVFAFTGQGASHKSMDMGLFHHSPAFRAQILHLDSLCQSQGFPSIIPAVDGSHPRDHAHPPTVTQLALACTEMALARYWESLGVRPDVVVGHSLGEYAALHVAGVLSAADAIFLVGRRAQMLEEKCRVGSHRMLAVRAGLGDVQAVIDRRADVDGSSSLEVACINGSRDTVLSGPADDVEAAAVELEGAGFKCFLLDVSFAFHSAQTEPILDELEETARKGVLFQPPNLPVISPLLGKVIFDEKTINATYIRRATRETVDFKTALEVAHKISTVDETMAWIEIGPHPVCIGFARSTLPSLGAAVPSLRRGEDDWKTISQSLAALHTAGVQVGWGEFHSPFERSCGLRLLDLPTYAWNNKNHWIQYNGDWALTKGNTFYDAEKKAAAESSGQVSNPLATHHSSLRTSLVHRVVEETFFGSAGRVIVQSDMMQADFLAAAWGHQMNGAGVVTSSIHADIAYTLGKYLISKLRPDNKTTTEDMNIANLVVREGLVAQKNTTVPQLIQVSITTADIDSGTASLEWHNLTNDGQSLVGGEGVEPIVTAQVRFGNLGDYLASWVPMRHLVQGRIDALAQLADAGVANRFSHSMAYLLFANNLVDYAEKYRGMQSVVLHGLEAYADITLSTGAGGGTWTVPPFFIDSVCHLAGFVMNVSDTIDTRANFCVTPGWGSLRLARPLVAGGRYRSYVRMIPDPTDPTVYHGDVYVLQQDGVEGEGDIVGVMKAIKFRRYPRVLLNRFFSAAEVKNPDSDAGASAGDAPHGESSVKPAQAREATQVPSPAAPAQPTAKPSQQPTTAAAPKPTAGPAATDEAQAIPPGEKPAHTSPEASSSSSAASRAMALVAAETGLESSDFKDDATFAEVGVDSLMSLVIAEKLREQLGIAVSGSLFLEYPTVGDLRAWLLEYHS